MVVTCKVAQGDSCREEREGLVGKTCMEEVHKTLATIWIWRMPGIME